MTTYAKRKLKYSRNENFNLLHYVEWDRFATLVGAKADRITLSYLSLYKQASNMSSIELFNRILIYKHTQTNKHNTM